MTDKGSVHQLLHINVAKLLEFPLMNYFTVTHICIPDSSSRESYLRVSNKYISFMLYLAVS